MVENKHLNYFKEYCILKEDFQGQIGLIPSVFWNNVTCNNGIFFNGFENINSQKLPKNKLNREEVIEFVNGDLFSFEEKLILIFAWGGMKIENAIIFFGNYLNYGENLKKVLCDRKINREEKFNKINNLNLKNCKTAYFTKLIFFFTANDEKPGYILDQWTAKAVNLILCSNIIKLDSQGYVKKNDSKAYGFFCEFIESLFEEINKSNHKILNSKIIEEYLFDIGGKKNSIGKWRKYVKDNYSLI